MILLQISILISFSLIIFLSILFVYFSTNNNSIGSRFFEYKKILECAMNQAYTVIYEEQIITYSLSAEKLDDAHFSKAMYDFCKLTKSLIGKKVLSKINNLYTEEAVNKNMCLFFIDRYENDQIRQKTTNNLLNNSE